MLSKRLVVCLDVQADRVVKGIAFESLRDIGNPVDLAVRYEAEGADEIVFLDISASVDARETVLDVARRTAEKLFIPLTVGGGVKSVDDIGRTLRAGADKVSINSAAVENPSILTVAAERFGAQCVVASIDARMDDHSWVVYTHGGRRRTTLDAVAWSRECVERGAGEILLTSIDRDGTRAGYDIELTRAVADAVSVPVVASGGAGGVEDVVDILSRGGAEAALVAGILHDQATSLGEIKRGMIKAGIPTRALA